MNSVSRLARALLLIAKIAPLTAALLPTAALAQTDPASAPPAHFGGQRAFGFGPSLGFSNGLGGMVGLGLPPVGLWLTGGYEPLLVVGNRNDPGHSVTVDGYGSAQVGADLALTPWHAGTRYDFGAIGGYRYNSVLGHGVGLGAVLTIDLGEALALFFSVEYVAFPRASDGLSSAGYPTDRSAALPWLQGGANVGLVVFP